MRFAKVAISVARETLEHLDRLVAENVFPSRSRAIQEAIEEKLARLARTRLAEECAKLNPLAEQALADEGLSEALREWPEY
ncbi:ribbon-helix-helix protein, CopG family [Candidatus Bipolaricaulota bacterium]|nr:ribbon-helix-helix protein, CopG family [Candidatus Bipolaricaulota bacterium]MCK4683094.1 ribbon-helix-helix protein, CopG family [Candidatus Bipolaricaulota bacterium]